MQNSGDFQRDPTPGSIQALGGEPLDGSGFETEQPEPGLSPDEFEAEV